MTTSKCPARARRRRPATSDDRRAVQTATRRSSRLQNRASLADSRPPNGQQACILSADENRPLEGVFATGAVHTELPEPTVRHEVLAPTQPQVRGFLHYAPDSNQFASEGPPAATVHSVVPANRPSPGHSTIYVQPSSAQVDTCAQEPDLPPCEFPGTRNSHTVLQSIVSLPTRNSSVIILHPSNTQTVPRGRQPYREPEGPHDLGRMDTYCVHCDAAHWLAERLSDSSASRPLFGFCCDKGQVSLLPLPEPPLSLRTLLTGNTPQAQEFRTNIRQYNAAFAFTSLGVNIDESVSGRGPYVFRIHGELCHRSGSLLPAEGSPPSYAQLYIFDPRLALQERIRRNVNLRHDTLQRIQAMLSATHRYTMIYRHAYEVLSLHEDADVAVRLAVRPDQDRRRYNLPSADDVAVILPGAEGETQVNDGRDIILRRRSGALQRIHEAHPAYAPLHYTLLFPFGTHGWHWDLRMGDGERRLSQTRFYSFQLQVRRGEFSTILHGGRLFQQYVVDMWAAAEQNRLRYLRLNQQQLRAAVYSGLEDALRGGRDVDLNELGQLIVLPSSFTGSPRHMQQLFQDGMAIARYFRNIDVFLTMTANPRWPEVERELLPGQTPSDRPDLISRVFQLKKKALLHDILKNGVFGRVVAHIYTIEFQKRGLPHMHLLIFLDRRDKLLDPTSVDSLIRATWPDPHSEPLLFEAVKSRMVHGPCRALNPSAPCMENGRCTKGFPKPFEASTSLDTDGYPRYCRPDDGRSYPINQHMLDNRWIVPYNPYLLVRYNCHINVECSVTFASVKYITKYIHKGHDRATLEIDRQDEIKTYLDARYISAPEAVWRMFHFGLHEQSPNVVRLQVHLPGHHLVTYSPMETPEMVQARAANERTMLTAFFDLNAQDDAVGDLARQHTYQELPQFFVWKASAKRWHVRRQGFALGRLYFVSPNSGDVFYLRLLLTVVRGPTSFEDLKTFNGTIYNTFQEACVARGLLEDDGEWKECLSEAADMQTGSRLRHLFVTLLLFCHPAHPGALWTQFRSSICDDLRHRLRMLGREDPSEEDIYDYGLFLLEKLLNEQGSSLARYPGMSMPSRNWGAEVENPYISEQLDYDPREEHHAAELRVSQMNPEQRAAFDQIKDCVLQNQSKVFFLNGPGGTGKTFVYETICHKIRGAGRIVLCVASSGLAALLLHGGRTAHSRFKIPVEHINAESTCPIPKESQYAEMLRRTSLIIWDEAANQHRYAPEAVDRTLRDLLNINKPFGGIPVVFGGDFQQILPVVVRGSREDIVAASLRRSYLWPHIQVLHLHRNMRLDEHEDNMEFAQWLLDVGHGRAHQGGDHGKIAIPVYMRHCRGIEDLIDAVYSGLCRSIDHLPPIDFFLHRSILSARNEDVDDINQRVLDRMPGEEQIYYSVDKIILERGADPDDDPGYPAEYLRSLKTSGMPLGELRLKVGAPIILLRNLSPSQGLCNGTRAIIRRMTGRVLEVELIGGQHHGEIALIPRITLNPSSTTFPFKLSRRQFPVRLAFAMSINKAQGQSIKYVGVDLRIPVFTHGQLYVALSRASSARRIQVLLPEDGDRLTTTNIVYPEVLLD